MELRTLGYFVAVAEAGSVLGAAERIGITQPALSRQLRRLERDLKVDLFVRGHGRLTLSHAGRLVLPRAKDLLRQAEALKGAAAFHAAGHLDRITVAAPSTTLTDVVAPFVATLGAADPVPSLVPADGLSPVDALAQGADLAIGTARPGPPFRSRSLVGLPVWAQVPPDHPWAGRAGIDLAELLGEPVVGLPLRFTARQALQAAVDATASSYGELLEAGDGTLAQALAAAGRGVAVVSDDPRFGLVPMTISTPHGPILIRLHVSWDSRHVATATLESLAVRLADFVLARYGPEPATG